MDFQLDKLTFSQVQVLRFLSSGFNQVETGEIMGISPKTVATHINGLKHKTGCKTLEQVMFLYGQKQEIDKLNLEKIQRFEQA